MISPRACCDAWGDFHLHMPWPEADNFLMYCVAHKPRSSLKRQAAATPAFLMSAKTPTDCENA